MFYRIIYFSLAIIILGCSQPKKKINIESSEFKELEQLYRDGAFDTCISQGRSFVEKYPQNSYGWSLMAGAYMAYRNDSMDVLADTYTEQALKLDNQNYVARLNKAILLDRKREHVEAYIHYNKVWEIRPDYPQLYSNLVGNRLKVKDYKLAVEYGEIAVKLTNQIGDKGVLCLSYHYNSNFAKRDSLFAIVSAQGYSNAEALKEIIERE